MKKIASLLVLFSILFPVCKGEKLNEEFFTYKKEWKNDPKKKMKLHRVEVDDKYFEFMLPEDMIKISRASEKYSGEPIESAFAFVSKENKNNQFYLIKGSYYDYFHKKEYADYEVIKDAVNVRFYNKSCQNPNAPVSALFITEKGITKDYPYFVDFDIFTKFNHGYVRDTIQMNCSKTIATDSTLYVFIYDTDDHIYEVPLEEKLAVMKSIRIISKEEAKAEEEENATNKIKFFISMLGLLLLVCIGLKLNKRS